MPYRGLRIPCWTCSAILSYIPPLCFTVTASHSLSFTACLSLASEVSNLGLPTYMPLCLFRYLNCHAFSPDTQCSTIHSALSSNFLYHLLLLEHLRYRFVYDRKCRCYIKCQDMNGLISSLHKDLRWYCEYNFHIWMGRSEAMWNMFMLYILNMWIELSDFYYHESFRIEKTSNYKINTSLYYSVFTFMRFSWMGF